MKTAGKKVLSMLLSLVMMVGVLAVGGGTPVYAIGSQTGNFNTGYNITGDGAQDIVNVALKQQGKTGSSFGYGAEWCSAFVSDCAKLAGQSSAVPWNGNQENLKNAVINAGGSQIYKKTGSYSATSFSDAKVGDLVFINWNNSNASSTEHVEIVYKVESGKIYTVGGNTGSGSNYNTRVVTVRTRNTQNAYEKTVWVVRPKYSTTPTGNNPIGDLNHIVGGTCNINLRGWAFDEDALATPVEVDIYIGGDYGIGEGHAILANTYRPDVHNAYGVGENHGFDATVSTTKTGHQPVYVYILNYGNGANVLLWSGYVDIAADTSAPIIKSAYITQQGYGGYLVVCEFQDDVGVTRVDFPTWTSNNGQNDIVYYQGILQEGGYAYANVGRVNHGYEYGEYITDVYVYDASGNYSIKTVRVNVENNKPVISNAKITNITPKGYTVSCDITDDTEIALVEFYIWSAQTGHNSTDQDDIECPKVSFDGKTATYNVKTSNHNNETGRYKTHIYVYDIWENRKTYLFENIYVPSASELYTVTYNANGGTGAPASHSDYVNVKLSSTKPTRNGYTFLGWATSSSATTAQYQPGETISPGKSITLYAVWEQTTFTLTYNPNGGANPPANQTGNGNITLSNDIPTKSGYSFLGWATSSSATTAQYQPGASFSLTNDTTLYAVWTPIILTNIFVNTLPTKTTYTVGESFSQSGLTLTAKYSDNSTQTINSGFTCSGFSSTTAGIKTITVKYEGKTTTFNVTVVNKDEPQPKIAIHNYVADKMVDFKTTITFSADVTNAVSGAAVHWFIDGQDKGTGDTYTVTKAKKSFTVQAKYMKDGKVLAESGVEKVNVKTGFFAKLAAFFRSIFGALPKVVQGYLGVEIIEKFI